MEREAYGERRPDESTIEAAFGVAVGFPWRTEDFLLRGLKAKWEPFQVFHHRRTGECQLYVSHIHTLSTPPRQSRFTRLRALRH